MVLESEIQKIETRAAARKSLTRSIIAFVIFLLSIAATIPGYNFPIKDHNTMLVLTGIALVTIIIAVMLAISNLVSFARKAVLKNWKSFFGVGLNGFIVLITLINIVLMFWRG